MNPHKKYKHYYYPLTHLDLLLPWPPQHHPQIYPLLLHHLIKTVVHAAAKTKPKKILSKSTSEAVQVLNVVVGVLTLPLLLLHLMTIVHLEVKMDHLITQGNINGDIATKRRIRIRGRLGSTTNVISAK